MWYLVFNVIVGQSVWNGEEECRYWSYFYFILFIWSEILIMLFLEMFCVLVFLRVWFFFYLIFIRKFQSVGLDKDSSDGICQVEKYLVRKIFKLEL